MAIMSKVSISVYHYSSHSTVNAVVTEYDNRGKALRVEVVRSAVWEREGDTPEAHMLRVADSARRMLYESEGLVP